MFTSVAQLLYKKGVETLSFDILSIITNYYIIIGLCLYAIGAVFVIVAMRGGEVSVLYPIVATSYVWVTLFASLLFGEEVSILRWFGVITIIFGIIAIGVGSKEKNPVIEYTEGL